MTSRLFQFSIALAIIVHGTMIYLLDTPEIIRERLLLLTFLVYLPLVNILRMRYLKWSWRDFNQYMTPFSNYGKTRELYFGRRE